MSPQPIANYEMLEKLGEGGMGVVWKARDKRLNRLVAIKTIPAKKLGDEGRRRRFVQEAQAASALNDPNIVTIYDIGSESGSDFLVMEYVDGKTLGQLIPRRGMRLEETLACAIQIAGALAKAHAAGIVHRDLKPGNIMVTAEGRVKLLDFGLAKLTDADAPGEDDPTRTLLPQSEEGSIIGTAAYMSPEQAESKPVDARSDIFSFGAVLYEMATGVRAFHGDSRLSTLSSVLHDNPKPPSQVVPGNIPRELDRIISRCLRKDPARRFQDAADLKVALEELKEESDSGIVEIASQGVVATRKGLSKSVLAGMVVILVIAACAEWVFLRTGSKLLPPMRSVPLTTYPGSEEHPSFSPDGSQVAFAWNGEKRDNWDIWVRMVEGGAPLRLTTNPARDYWPAWSPDGRQIAFIREGSGVYSISPLAGPERKLTDAHADELAWMPDSQSLLISSAPSHEKVHRILQLFLRTGELRNWTSPPQTSSGYGDFMPAVSPDAQKLAFVRSTGSSGDIYLRPFASGTAYKMSKSSQPFAGLTWANNREIVFARITGGSGTGSLWRMASDGNSEPQPVAGAVDGALEPAISHPPNGPARLAYVRWMTDTNIWGMEIAVEGNGRVRTLREPAAVIASTRADQSPQISPDGKRIAFVSERDGYLEIWVSAIDGSNPSQLTTLKGPRSGSPKWSPDGRQIVFDSLASGNNDIWVAGSEGGSARQITKEPSNDARPSWSRDGRWIYFRSDRSGSQQIWKIPAAEPYTPATQVTRNGGFEAVESMDGSLLYYVKPDRRGLWSVGVEGGDETLVQPSIAAAYWTVGERGVYYLDVMRELRNESAPLVLLSLPDRKLVEIARIGKTIGNTQVFSVSRDGRQVVWTQLDHEESDLMLIDGFR